MSGAAGRFAPSPTGALHLGNLRTAVLAWLFARSSGRRLRLRVEDLDAGRLRPGSATQQQVDLAALGVKFDGEALVQSGRLDRYAAALEQLSDHTYECFCTRREIAEAASAPHEAVRAYPGTCAELTQAQRAERRQTRPPALRLRANRARQRVRDEVYGSVTGIVDDVVLRRSDGTPAYHLACVVDDGDSGVDQVVRGEDLLISAPSQAHLAGLLGLAAPTYAHVPLAVNEAGARLSKRDGAVTLAELAGLGMGPDRVLGLLAESLGLADRGEPVTLLRLLERFDPALLPRDPWVVRPQDITPADLAADSTRSSEFAARRPA